MSQFSCGRRRANAMRSALLCASLLAAGCGEDASVEPEGLPGDDVVLAQVDGSRITEYDLQASLTETLGAFAASVDDETRHDVLESLVGSRAIAARRESELTPRQLAAIDRAVARHREQLLVRSYLAEHSPVGAVTDEEIRAYYEAHADRFGGRPMRRYEMVFATRELDETERRTVLEALQPAPSRDDWASWVAELQARGLPIGHRAGSGDEGLVHSRLTQTLAALPIGRSSGPLLVEGRVFVLRVTGEGTRSARPLEEVRDEIRTALGPRAMRRSLSEARREALVGAEVVYSDGRVEESE